MCKGFTFSALLLQGTKVWHPVYQPQSLAIQKNVFLISWRVSAHISRLLGRLGPPGLEGISAAAPPL